MRLLRLEGEGLGGRAIDLHPEISVLTDLDADLRERLLRACHALPGGEDPGCDGLIEAHGVLFDLGESALELLGFGESVDVLVETGASATVVDDGPSTAEVLDEVLVALRARRGELDRAQLDVLSRLEAARAALDPFARTGYEQARARADRAAGLTDIDADLEALDDPGPLQERLAEIERLDRELAEVDLDAMVEALAAAVDDDDVDPEAVEAGRLAVELRQIDTELADLDAALQAQGMHPIELAKRRDALSMDVARLESEHAPRELDPDDSSALEAAHDEVVSLQRKVDGSLLGGRNAERRLEEAVDLERQVLERMGLPTYTAYVMTITVGNSDADLDNRLHEARQGLAACQADFEAATELLEHDPARSMLTARQEEIVVRAGELVGRDPGVDVVASLLAFKSDRDATDPVEELRHELERGALIEPGIPLEPDELCDFAAAWIEQMIEGAESGDIRVEEAAELRDRLEEIEQACTTAEERRAEAEGMEPSDELVAARQRLDAHETATEEVAQLTEILAEVDRNRQQLDSRLETQQVLADLARSGAGTRTADADEFDRQEAVRALLRDRLAVHRDRSFAGSVPMVLRGLFSGFDRDSVGRLLGDLEDTADGVQLIILDDDLPVVTWATSVGIERAAVVSPE